MSLSVLEQSVIKLIDQSRDDIVALMQKLVQIPSYSGEEKEKGEFLVKEVTKFSLDDVRIVQKVVDRPNVMGHYYGKTGKPSLTVYAHYDTIPAGDVTKWTYGPFSGAIVGTRYMGEGLTIMSSP
jgi:succinyl-diaminopimelate desuccinylase